MRELLEKDRLRWGRRNRGTISEAQVEESFLHHEDLGVALERRRTLLETAELDELKFCEPCVLVSQERAKQALLEFVNLEDRDEAAAIGYINEFGEFDHLDRVNDVFVGSDIPEAIQKFCKECIGRRQSPFAVSLHNFWAVRDDIEGLLNLSRAVDSKDVQRARDECIRRRPNSTFDREPNWLAVGKAILCADLSAALNPGHRNPRLLLSDKEGKLVPLTMGTSVRSALYLTLLDMIVSKTAYKKCLNCKERFIFTVKRKQYCNEACQNAAKARRFRSRHKGTDRLGSRSTELSNHLR